ncbi:MAG: hypothetical protein WB709_11360 [Solirubrobacteraceae bacterium]
MAERKKSATSERSKSAPSERDEPVKIDLDPEEALRALLAVEPVMSAEDMARKHDLDGLSLRNMLREHPDLTPGHRHGEEYEITPEIERAVSAHPAFQSVKKR